jgi:hypothetical protein
MMCMYFRSVENATSALEYARHSKFAAPAVGQQYIDSTHQCSRQVVYLIGLISTTYQAIHQAECLQKIAGSNRLYQCCTIALP